jgi:hypothetical protein
MARARQSIASRSIMATQPTIASARIMNAAVGGGLTYPLQPETAAYLAAHGVASARFQNAVNTLVYRWKNYGFWPLLTACYLLGAENKAGSLKNLKSPGIMDAIQAGTNIAFTPGKGWGGNWTTVDNLTFPVGNMGSCSVWFSSVVDFSGYVAGATIVADASSPAVNQGVDFDGSVPTVRCHGLALGSANGIGGVQPISGGVSVTPTANWEGASAFSSTGINGGAITNGAKTQNVGVSLSQFTFMAFAPTNLSSITAQLGHVTGAMVEYLYSSGNYP